LKFLKKNIRQFCYDIYKLRGHEFYKNISSQNKEKYHENKHRIKTLKEYRCILCGGERGEVLLKWNKDYQLVSCDTCFAVTANITIESNDKHVSGVYNELQYKATEKNILSTYQYRKETFGKERYDYCIKRFGLDESKISVLDVGCGVGYFLSVLKEHGIKSVGLEVDPYQVEFCKNKGLNVTSENIEQLNNKQFDLIVMFDVLEHLVEPVKIFKELNSKLKKNGRIVAYTPYISSFAFELMQEKQNLLHPFQHLCFYDENSLNYLSKTTGFEIESIDNYGLDVADYLLYKEYKDNYPYVEKLKDLMYLMQGVLDRSGISNHIRVTFHKK
jgi:2-polyprenyl-3-methyl-5-hydroxy-6-metoxy-1,4-benzoquinol methylase